MKIKHKWIPFVFLISVTLWLRLANLGYSDYQGDELKAMWRPIEGQSAIEFLYLQKKGPIQFVITYLIKLLDPAYSNEFLLRLPFSLAGILAIFFFYRLVSMHYGNKIALYATLLLSTNGLFIGLMRIVQYQPFVILFMILALYSFTLALQQKTWRFRGIYLGVTCWTLALLSHYDGIFIAPFAIYLLVRWYFQNKDLPTPIRIKHLLIPFTTSASFLAVYFVPYLLMLPDSTKEYWAGRMASQEVTGQGIPSSILNFQLYNPIISIYLYLILGVLSLPKIRQTLPVWAWFALPWAVLELAIFDPGTHIYTYLLPAIILLAFGLAYLEEQVVRLIGARWGRRLSITGIALLFISFAGISHLIFIDHTPEYPFEKRGMLFWTIGGAEEMREHRFWVFGFPYNRRWEEIRDLVTSTQNNGYYTTNEKDTISNYYIPFKLSVKLAGHYIYIHNPQSTKTWDRRVKIEYWRENYKPVKVLENNGRVVAEVYYMPPGSLDEIKKAGY